MLKINFKKETDVNEVSTDEQKKYEMQFEVLDKSVMKHILGGTDGGEDDEEKKYPNWH
jgi:hypothetical protein